MPLPFNVSQVGTQVSLFIISSNQTFLARDVEVELAEMGREEEESQARNLHARRGSELITSLLR